MEDNSFIDNASSYFDTLMTKKYIKKSEIISLKQKLKALKKESASSTYNNILNRITNIANNANGKNLPSILKKVYDDFNLIKRLTKKEQ